MGKIFLAITGALALATSAAGSASAGANLVVNGDFSAGNTGFSAGYTLTTMTPQLFQNGVHGIYAVLPIGDVNGQAAYGDWHNVTTDPFGGNGNVYAADGATDANVVVWSETVTVKPNTNYDFSFYAAEISNACCSNASLAPTVSGTDGTALGLNGGWQQNAAFVWNSGSNTTATLSMIDTNTDGSFNDFVLTDISFSSVGVPEPSSWALMLLGVGLSGAALRRRRAPVRLAA
jgi:hypothetical protein